MSNSGDLLKKANESASSPSPTEYKNQEASQAAEQAKTTKSIEEKKIAAAKDTAAKPSSGQSSSQKEIKCPIHQAEMIQNTGGRQFASITRLLKNVIHVDISSITGLLGPKKVKADPSKCKACKGKGTIKDVTDSKSKDEQVAQYAKQNSEAILTEEAKLGLGGSRHTIVTGNDLLQVGLVQNTNKTYNVHQNAGIRSRGLGPQKENMPMPQGGQCNVVEGVQTPWPEAMGSYTIKCAHKLHLDSGAGGTVLSTKGPLVIQSGKVLFTGPEITIGCESGPLTLTGEVVNINGKSIEIGPTDGHLFVKGTISNTGNMITAGHTHSESISFVKASCPSSKKFTDLAPASPGDSIVSPAVWGGVGVKGITAAIAELQQYYKSLTTDIRSVMWRLSSPAEMEDVSFKTQSLAKMSMPWEMSPTGYILPGTQLLLSITGTGTVVPGTGTSGAVNLTTATATVIAPINVNNFPHTHVLPSMVHKHSVLMPDIDFEKNDSAATVRKKFVTDALSSGAPLHVNTQSESLLAKAQSALNTVIAATDVIISTVRKLVA